MRHFACLLLSVCPLVAQLTTDQLKEDLRIAREAVADAHGGAFRYTPKATFDRGFDQAQAKLTRPMSVLEFYRVVAPAVAQVKCGHTSVSLPADLLKELQANLKVVPFDVDILDKGRVYIHRDFSGQKLEGAEILAINGKKVADILAVLEPATPGDGNIAVGRYGRLARGGFVRGLHVMAGMDAPYRVTYRLPGQSKDITTEFAGITSAQRPQTPAPPPPPPIASLEFKGDSGKIALLTIRSFGGFADRERKVPLSGFLTEAFTTMKEKGATALIIDVRGNGGGQDALGKQLYAHLTDKDFLYYESLTINAKEFASAKYFDRPLSIPPDRLKPRADGRVDTLGHPNLGIQKPAEPRFAGPVFALADRDSFSATGEFLTSYFNYNRGRIIGEETGAAFSGNTSGAGVSVTLPHSKLRINIPLMSYVLPVNASRPSPPDRGVMPDIPVTPTIADKIAGLDPVMAKALELAAAASAGKAQN